LMLAPLQGFQNRLFDIGYWTFPKSNPICSAPLVRVLTPDKVKNTKNHLAKALKKDTSFYPRAMLRMAQQPPGQFICSETTD
ncbi:MAG: hypothetical protein JXR61_07555, partial [Prolixibacteraceae bacterium]|nr:hypothetical protein [Prolixibacteraceae bacterium]